VIGTDEHEPKWRRLPGERPQQILDAAIEVFGDHGLAEARLEDIAKRAGVSKGTIYLYFPNKEALFKEMIRQTVVDQLEQAERDLVNDRSMSATDQVRHFMRWWWDLMRRSDYQRIYRLVVGELQRFPELVEFFWDEVIVRRQLLLDRLIQRGVDSGEFRTVNPTTAGRIVTSMLSAHSLWACTRFYEKQELTDEIVFDQIMDYFFHSLSPSAALATTAPSKS
jgi:AcrR family transcriptional regulator